MNTELHRPLKIGDADGRVVDVAANDAECRAIAERLGVQALHSLHCQFRLRAQPAGRFAAQGRIQASLTLNCVVTLDDFPARLDEAFTLAFVPAGLVQDDLDADAEDEAEYDGNEIDLGEAAVQQLALILPPFPRKPGATLPEGLDEPANPFAALGALKTRH